MANIAHIIALALCTLFITNANAALYMGAGLGPDNIKFNKTSKVSGIGFNVVDKTNLSATGIFATTFMGYEYHCNNFSISSEINANLSSASSKSSNKEYVHLNFSSTTYKIKNSYGVSVLPGYQFLENTLVYARLGYSNAQVKVSTSDTSLESKTRRSDGFRKGLGIRQGITKNIFFRIEYSLAKYNDIKMSTFDKRSLVTKNTSISPHQQLVEFGVLVLFDLV